ncbi:VacJ family lipoprotein [Halorhodospira halochloris]|uniref:MlaA family lipoprotein n=1 Tax=Halorhodospira halochloris TaxID=1052 RepID=UPI001EE84F2A|nr:VacJ family lipoprotein [Halorhodospira halochloris]MCG5547376.1 VacJ family lipoprotein [Halorhodospira halochloris]
MTRLFLLALLACIVAVAGCASSPEANNPNDTQDEEQNDDWNDDWGDDDDWNDDWDEDGWDEGTSDPLERYNRWVHSFNMTADEYLIRPVAVTYKEQVPDGIRNPIGNFFRNLLEPFYALNHYLQGDGEQGARSINRFFVNSTVGVLGLFDVAGSAGLERERTDLGLTLGHWGTPEGPYIVLPFLGPSTLRDSSGLALQYLTRDYHSVYFWADVDHHQRYLATGLYGLDLRAGLLSLDEMMERTGADPYIFMRESYLQNRREQLGEDDWDDWDDDWDDDDWDNGDDDWDDEDWDNGDDDWDDEDWDNGDDDWNEDDWG